MPSLGEFEVAAQAADPNREPDTFVLRKGDQRETFTVSDQIGIIPLGRFAKAATSGLDTAEMEGLAALVDLLADVVIDEDRERFLHTAAKFRAGGEQLMPIVRAVIEAQAGRPTAPLSDSSDGRSSTGESLKAPSPFGQVAPIQLDPRVRELQSVQGAALSLVG